MNLGGSRAFCYRRRLPALKAPARDGDAMTFKALLDDWSNQVQPKTTAETYAVNLEVKDAARIHALDELFPGVDRERIITDLISTALDEIEAAIPYEAGDEVIREDDFGDPVYADAGLTPRFLELVQSHKAALES